MGHGPGSGQGPGTAGPASRMTIIVARPPSRSAGKSGGAEVTIDPARRRCKARTGSRAALKQRRCQLASGGYQTPQLHWQSATTATESGALNLNSAERVPDSDKQFGASKTAPVYRAYPLWRSLCRDSGAIITAAPARGLGIQSS